MIQAILRKGYKNEASCVLVGSFWCWSWGEGPWQKKPMLSSVSGIPKEGKALVQIYKADSVYSGKIVWLKEPKNDDGSEKLDTNNPDEAKQGMPIIGLNLVNGFVYKERISGATERFMIPTTARPIPVK